MRISIVPDQIGGLAGLIFLSCLLLFDSDSMAQTATEDFRNDDIEIVAGGERTIYEYRVNGILMLIKVVPKAGKPYYMVPADGSAHYQDLDHKKKLYPQWVILEW